MHGSEGWGKRSSFVEETTRVCDDSAIPLTYMIVYTVRDDSNKLKSGIYMFDEETIKTYFSYENAATDSELLMRFMKNCGFDCRTRVVKVVNS